MCFSAGASFGAGAILVVAGTASLTQVRSRGTFLLACVPLFFGIQQLTEGALWMALQNPAYRQWERPATYTFLAFAEVIWPVMVPLTVWTFEPDRKRKRILAAFLAFGICVSAYLLVCLAIGPVVVFVKEHHIRYEVRPAFAPNALVTAAYCVAAVVPPFLSTVGRLRWLGALLLISLIATAIFYKGYFISVWCFFAALLSAAIFLIIRQINRTTGSRPGK